MLKDWYNSSLQKIVPSENKGAKFYGKVAKEKNKKDYTIKESHLKISLFPGATCLRISGPIVVP